MLDLSIIIINKNYFRFLKRCLQSCFEQKTKYNYEIIVIDDGSKDGSVQYLKQIKDKRFKFIKSKNEGIEKASNKGFKKSIGKYVVRVDSDDYLNVNFIQTSIKEIENSKKDFVYSNYFQIDTTGKIIKKKFLPIFSKHEIIARGDFLATGTVYKREIIKNFNFYNEKTKNCGLENYELILKLISDKKKGKKIDKFLFFYRMHKKNISVIKEKKITSYGKKLFTKMNLQQYSKNQFHPWV
jgi:glycosyltransferase involved in cell wall biosynthesis